MLFDDAFIVLSPEWIGRFFVRFRDATVEMSHFPQLFHQTLQGKQNNNALLDLNWSQLPVVVLLYHGWPSCSLVPPRLK